MSQSNWRSAPNQPERVELSLPFAFEWRQTVAGTIVWQRRANAKLATLLQIKHGTQAKRLRRER